MTDGTQSAVTASPELLFTFGENTVYLMGFSFVLGSMFTILILILLDFMRRNSEQSED